MGKPNPKYFKSLEEQMHERLVSMQQFGVSRHFLKENGTAKEAISSVSTYRTYLKWARYFAAYMKEHHPDVTTMQKARKYVGEYLAALVVRYEDGELSAATIKTQTSALNKIFGISVDDPDYSHPPKMNRTDIKRSRHVKPGSGIEELDEFARSTGLRPLKELEVLHGGDYTTYDEIKNELAVLEQRKAAGEKLPRDDYDHMAACRTALRFADRTYFVIVRNGKGGKIRYAPILGDHVDQIVGRIKTTPDGERVFMGVSHSVFTSMNGHALRAEYAARVYHAYAVPVDQLPRDAVNLGSGKGYRSRLYACRGEFAGRKYDRFGLGLVAVALGHNFNRVHDVVNHYAYKF